MKTILSSFICLLLVLQACSFDMNAGRIEGKKPVVAQKIAVNDFNEICVSNSFNVIISTSDSPEIIIETNEDLLQYVEVVQDGMKVDIRIRKNINISNSKLIAYISTGNINVIRGSGAVKFSMADDMETDNLEVILSGACNFNNENKIKCKKMNIKASGACKISCEVDIANIEVNISGASKASISGKAVNAVVSSSGACKINSPDLSTDYLDLKASGACNSYITVNKEASINISGSSDFSYKGNGAIVSAKSSGASSIKKID